MALTYHFAIYLIVMRIFLPAVNGQMDARTINPEEIEMFLNLIQNIAGSFSSKDLIRLPAEISKICADDVTYTLAQLVTKKTWSNVTNSWAVHMLDSFGKPPAGVMTGNLFWLGSYQQCLNVVAPTPDSKKEKFIGEYCIVDLQQKHLIIHKYMTMDIKIGMCFPSTCSFQDKSLLLNYTLTPFQDSIQVAILEDTCQTRHAKSMDKTTIILTCIITSFGLLVVATTLKDVLTVWKKGRKATEWLDQSGMTLLSSFSATRNLKALFHISEPPRPLSAINGIRVLSSYWIIACHTWSYTHSPYPWKNQKDFFQVFESFLLQPFFFAGTFAVTSFFAVSGFLVTYNFIEISSSRKQSPSIFKFYLHRYVRLTVPMILVLMYLSGPGSHMNDGPIWSYAAVGMVKTCRSQWWKSILYIQNIIMSEREVPTFFIVSWKFYTKDLFIRMYVIHLQLCAFQCLQEGWYLSVDTQLYILAPVILVQLYKKRLLGFILMGLSVAASVVYYSYLIVINNYLTFAGKKTDFAHFVSYHADTQYKTLYNLSPYVVGMAAGYLYYVIQKNGFTIQQRTATLLSILSLTTMFVIVFGTYPYFKGSAVMGVWMNVMYGALGRPAWALCVSWIILACGIGYGGAINWFLTRPFFVVLGRLTFCMYLTHNLVIGNYYISQRDSLYFSTYNLCMLVISNMVLTSCAALFLTVFIDMPTSNILKLFGGKTTTIQQSEKQE